jgi:hypothetical protein
VAAGAAGVAAAGVVLALALISSRKREPALEPPPAAPASELATGEHAAL